MEIWTTIAGAPLPAVGERFNGRYLMNLVILFETYCKGCSHRVGGCPGSWSKLVLPFDKVALLQKLLCLCAR